MKIAAFKHITKSKPGKMVLIDFYADWCGPCQTISPMINKVSRNFGDSVQVIKVNVDKSRPIAEKFNIRSIPTLVLLRGDKVLWKNTGLITQKELSSKLTDLIK